MTRRSDRRTWFATASTSAHGSPRAFTVTALVVARPEGLYCLIGDFCKSGTAAGFPRILRWRIDKAVADVDTLDSPRQLLADRDDARAPVGGAARAQSEVGPRA